MRKESVLQQLKRGKRFKYYRLENGRVVRKTAAEALEYELGHGESDGTSPWTYCVLKSGISCSVCGRAGSAPTTMTGRV